MPCQASDGRSFRPPEGVIEVERLQLRSLGNLGHEEEGGLSSEITTNELSDNLDNCFVGVCRVHVFGERTFSVMAGSAFRLSSNRTMSSRTWYAAR